MNKLYKLIILSFVMITSIMFSNELAELQSPKSASNAFSEAPAQQLPNLQPFPSKGYDIGLSVDFLYWGIELGGLNYATSSNAAVPPPQSGETKTFDFSYNPGFRVGVNTVFPHNLWNVNFEYTYIHLNDTKTEGYGFSPLYNIGNLLGNNLKTITANSLKAQFKQTFNNLDISLAKYLQLSKWILFKPFIGIEGAYIDNSFNTWYYSAFGAPLLAATDLSMTMRTYYWAVGLKGGFDSIWHITKAFSIEGNFALSLLSSHFDVTRKDYTASPATPNIKAQRANVNSSFYTGTFVLDFFLGLRYEAWSKADTWHFSLSAGWEPFIWYNMNQSIIFNGPNSSSDSLNMQGLTLKAMISF